MQNLKKLEGFTRNTGPKSKQTGHVKASSKAHRAADPAAYQAEKVRQVPVGKHATTLFDRVVNL